MIEPFVTPLDAQQLGRRIKPVNDYATMTPAQLRRRAAEIHNGGDLSAKAKMTIKWLSLCGVMTSDQIHRVVGMSEKTLRSYVHKGYLQRLYILRKELVEVYGMSKDKIKLSNKPAGLHLNTLSPIGQEIARLLGETPHVDVFEGYGTQLIRHDILVNEVSIRLMEAAYQNRIRSAWSNRFDSTVKNINNSPILEPDAYIEFNMPDGEKKAVLLEYHNEDNSRRGMEKIERYEKAIREGKWKEKFSLDTFPPVLVVFTHKAVAEGYARAINALKKKTGVRTQFYGKSWKMVLSGEDINNWWCFNTQKNVELFPWMTNSEEQQEAAEEAEKEEVKKKSTTRKRKPAAAKASGQQKKAAADKDDGVEDRNAEQVNDKRTTVKPGKSNDNKFHY